jgi:hypothetical protein
MVADRLVSRWPLRESRLVMWLLDIQKEGIKVTSSVTEVQFAQSALSLVK